MSRQLDPIPEAANSSSSAYPTIRVPSRINAANPKSLYVVMSRFARTYFITPYPLPSDFVPRTAKIVRWLHTIFLLVTLALTGAFVTLTTLCANAVGQPSSHCTYIPFVWLFMSGFLGLTVVFFMALYYAQPSSQAH